MEYRIATADEVSKQFDWLIDTHDKDKDNWIYWKKENINEVNNGYVIPYYGFIDNICICEAYAVIHKNIEPLFVDKEMCYLKAFRTRPDYRNQGYFSGLFRFMIQDLKNRGYKYATVGVDSNDELNKIRYTMRMGFNQYLQTIPDTYPDGSVYEVEYYLKLLF